jgi:hypothetical protein
MSPEEKRNRRLEEIKAWFEEFASMMLASGNTVDFEPFAAEQVNASYWSLLEENARPYMVKHEAGEGAEVVDRHKIASLTELVIATTQPIHHENEAIKNQYNAILAFCCAMNVMKGWGYNIRRKHMDNTFVSSHVDFLVYIAETKEMPVFANAATWYLVEKLAELLGSPSGS